MEPESILEQLRKSGYYTTDGHYRLVSGKHSDAYVQARLFLMDPAICESFVKVASRLLPDAGTTAVAAFTVGGLLLGDALAARLKIDLVRGRKRGDTIEWLNPGPFSSEARVLLVDDVLTTASQVNLAISSLERTPLGSLVGVLLAVDRSSETPELSFKGDSLPVRSCVRIPLTVYDPSACPLCRIGIPPTDLSNPEQNFISVLLSQPADRSEYVLRGYERVYKMQDEGGLLAEIKAWKPWLPVLIAGLPMPRMEEDSRLIRFVGHLASVAEKYGIRRRVLSELVGQLVSLSSIRIESRPVGCSILVGDAGKISNYLESKARVELPTGVSCEDLRTLIPYLDAFVETHYAMVFDRDGKVVDLRRLVYNRPSVHTEGTELIKFVTSVTSSLGFVLRRGRSAISVYGNGRLEAVGELSERTGLWEFSRPMERVAEIDKLLPGISESLATVVEASRELVANSHGGLFVVGDSTGLRYTDPKVHIEPQPLKAMSMEDIVELAKLDGAVIVNEGGELVHATVIIQNKDDSSAARAAPGLAHGGSRKETARRTSVECPGCAVVYASQNGAIEVYARGDSWSIAEAIPGLARA